MMQQTTQADSLGRVFPFPFEGGLTLFKAPERPRVLEEAPMEDAATSESDASATEAEDDAVTSRMRTPFTCAMAFPFEGGISIFEPEETDICLYDPAQGAVGDE